MKISPLSAPGTTVGAIGSAAEPQTGMAQRLRSLKMNVNRTPGREAEAPPAEELTIPGTSDGEQAANEATQPLSPQAAALARARRALQVKERALLEREKALEGKKPSDGDYVSVADLIAKPLEVLLAKGVTYEQLTQAVLASQDGADIRNLEAKLKAMEEGFDKKLSDRDAQTETQVLDEMEREARRIADTDPEFEAIKARNGVKFVRDLIHRTYKESGDVLDVRDAMKMVEDELFAESLKLANLKKVQSKLAPQPAPIPPTQQQRQRTLTNRDTASVPMSAKARALAAFNGTLKR